MGIKVVPFIRYPNQRLHMPATQDGNREIDGKRRSPLLGISLVSFCAPFPIPSANDGEHSASSAADLHPNSKISGYRSEYSRFAPQNMGTPGAPKACPIGLRTYVGGDSIEM